MANWLRAKDQSLRGIVHFFIVFFKAKNMDFLKPYPWKYTFSFNDFTNLPVNGFYTISCIDHFSHLLGISQTEGNLRPKTLPHCTNGRVFLPTSALLRVKGAESLDLCLSAGTTFS